MANVLHPILGVIDLSTPGSWDAKVNFGSRAVTFDLNFDGSDVTVAQINDLPRELEDLEPLDRAARLAIVQDAQSGDDESAATLYITHHHSEFSPAEFTRLFGTDRPNLTDCAPLLSRLALVRVGLYPESEHRPILLDYSIGRDATNYLLCVSFDWSREPTAVDMES
jgi:hypothetical protein